VHGVGDAPVLLGAKRNCFYQVGLGTYFILYSSVTLLFEIIKSLQSSHKLHSISCVCALKCGLVVRNYKS